MPKAIASVSPDADALLDVVDERLPASPYDQQNAVLLGRLGDRKVAVKVFREDALDRWSREAEALVRFARFGLPVAELIDSGCFARASGAFLIMARLSGVSLADTLRSAARLDEERVGVALAELLGRQVERGAVRGAAGRAAIRRASPNFKWRGLVHRYRDVLTGPLCIHPATLRAIGSWASTLADGKHPCWVTTDWRLRHVLWSNDEISGLLDFEYAQVLDRSSELGYLLQDVVVHGCAPTMAGALAAASGLSGDHAESERVRFFVVFRSLEHAAFKYMQNGPIERLAREAAAGVDAFGAGSLEDVFTAVRAA